MLLKVNTLQYTCTEKYRNLMSRCLLVSCTTLNTRRWPRILREEPNINDMLNPKEISGSKWDANVTRTWRVCVFVFLFCFFCFVLFCFFLFLFFCFCLFFFFFLAHGWRSHSWGFGGTRMAITHSRTLSPTSPTENRFCPQGILPLFLTGFRGALERRKFWPVYTWR